MGRSILLFGHLKYKFILPRVEKIKQIYCFFVATSPKKKIGHCGQISPIWLGTLKISSQASPYNFDVLILMSYLAIF